MTESPLIAPDDAAPRPARRAPSLPVVVAIVVLALIAAGAGWWRLNHRATVPDWERLSEAVLAAPAGDAFASDTPWVQVRLAPLRPDAENTMQAIVGYGEGTPVPAGGPPRVTAVTAQPVSGEPAGPEAAAIEAGETTRIVAFVAPEQNEPRRRTIAWHVWWVGTETGQVRREAMVSRQHYMLNRFSDFNEPVEILPPEGAGTPAAGTPTLAAPPVP